MDTSPTPAHPKGLLAPCSRGSLGKASTPEPSSVEAQPPSAAASPPEFKVSGEPVLAPGGHSCSRQLWRVALGPACPCSCGCHCDLRGVPRPPVLEPQAREEGLRPPRPAPGPQIPEGVFPGPPWAGLGTGRRLPGTVLPWHCGRGLAGAARAGQRWRAGAEPAPTLPGTQGRRCPGVCPGKEQRSCLWGLGAGPPQVPVTGQTPSATAEPVLRSRPRTRGSRPWGPVGRTRPQVPPQPTC